MPKFKIYLEIRSQGHKKKLSSKFKKNKKSQQFFAESLRIRLSAKVLCREPGCPALGKESLPRAVLSGPRQRFFAESLLFTSRQRVFSLKKKNGSVLP
jgi:hypothetical protein